MGDESQASQAGSLTVKFGAVMGKGAAKYGKKAAQSEAGRRATTAAVQGACDGVRDDMVNRYGTGPPPEAAPAPSTTTTTQTEKKPATTPSWDVGGDDNINYSSPSSSSYQSSKPSSRKSSGAPPKPSLFDKLKFTRKNQSRTTSRPRPRVDPRERVYKSRLARTADWDRLPLAQALYNFKGEMKCDLEFRKGQVIQVITRTETTNDWWEGKLEDRVGIFPANYVKLM